MIPWLESLPTINAGIVIVGGFVLIALSIGYLVSKFTSREVRMAHNDRAGFILAVIGVVYAVLLAFVAIGVWERFQGAEARTYEEAGAIATVYRDAGSFPGGAKLRAMLRTYVYSIIYDEWPQMRRGERSPISNELLEAADRYVRALPVDTHSSGEHSGADAYDDGYGIDGSRSASYDRLERHQRSNVGRLDRRSLYHGRIYVSFRFRSDAYARADDRGVEFLDRAGPILGDCAGLSVPRQHSRTTGSLPRFARNIQRDPRIAGGA